VKSYFDKYTVNDTKFMLLAEPYTFDADREEIKNGITGGAFLSPKDMKYSITVFIEEKDASGVKTEYELRYDYYLVKKDNWLRLLI
jgi:hypothetical protein